MPEGDESEVSAPVDEPTAVAGPEDHPSPGEEPAGEGREEEPAPTGRPGRWRRVLGGLAAGAILGSAITGGALAWKATRAETFPPLVAAWALLAPAALVAAFLALPTKPGRGRRRLRQVGACLTVVIVGGLVVATRGVEPCDKRAPGVKLAGCHLAGRNLSGRNLSGADLTGADLRGARLVATDLRGAVLVKTRLSGIKAARVDLGRADLRGAVLDRADLSDAHLEEAKLSTATLVGATMPRISARSVELDGGSLGGADLSGADLAAARFAGAAMEGANLSGARASGIDLSRAKASGAVFDGADLSAATLTGADLSKGSFTKTRMAKAQAAGANFAESTLAGTNLHEARLGAAGFVKARVTDADLGGADLTGASMTGVEMRAVALEGAVLAGTKDLNDAALAGALGVEEARVSRALSLRSARFDTPEQVTSAVARVCVGLGTAGARPYGPTPGFHALVVLDNTGKIATSGAVGQLRTIAKNGNWEPAGVRYAELVACVADERRELVQDCGPYTGDSGGVRNFIRERLTRQVRLVSALTGAVVSERTFSGDTPRGCLATERGPTAGTTPVSITGSSPSVDDMGAWLTEAVHP